MSTLRTLTPALLCELFRLAEASLDRNKEEVNALNVFPVPDGDTGTNMCLTMKSAVAGLNERMTVAEICAAVSRGALMGARGNSGVILSQIMRGLTNSLSHAETLDSRAFAQALQSGVEIAYKSVLKPVEGTILTVSRLTARAAVERAAAEDDLPTVMAYALEKGRQALANTPNQLPVLKEAGVVDSGGRGFILLIEGALLALEGKDDSELPSPVAVPRVQPPAPKQPAGYDKAAVFDKAAAMAEAARQDIPYAYCTELMIHGAKRTVEEVRTYLSTRIDGDSLVAVGDEGIVKIHYHTNDPGRIISYCVTVGELFDIKIENMKEQMAREKAEREAQAAPVRSYAKTCGVVAVAAGDGMAEICRSLGVDEVISGGQTMNPSAEDLLQAIEGVDAAEIIILPNNSNIILAAQQVVTLTDRPVAVLPTKFVTQGLNALLSFNPEQSAADNAREMQVTLGDIHNGEITYAIRDSAFNGFTIKSGDILGLMEGEIIAVDGILDETVGDVVAKMAADGGTLLTLYYGADVAADDADALGVKLGERFPDMEIEIYRGGQPLYYYLLSVE